MAGVVLVLPPLQLPILAQGHLLSWVIAIAMPAVGIANLLVLARTHAFKRYAQVLVVMVLLFPAAIEVLLGGIGGASAAVVFAFLGPVLALLALGPRRAVGWFAAFVAVVIAVVILDPVVSRSIEPQPYPTRLIWYVANLLVPSASRSRCFASRTSGGVWPSNARTSS
jgi:adenylate cyclase